MKTTKRVLSVLLVLALGLMLMLPTAAAEGAVPIFTQHMPNKISVKPDETITLKAIAVLPEGIDAELKYQWYVTEWDFRSPMDLNYFETVKAVLGITKVDPTIWEYTLVEGATEPQLTVCIIDPISIDAERIYCLKAFYELEDGTIMDASEYTFLTCYTLQLVELYRSIAKDILGEGSNRLIEYIFYAIVTPYVLLVYPFAALAYLIYRVK